MAGHILTIEDPIEFLFSNKKSVVNQREVGRDTQSLQVALKNALRQAPDCILIGEIRDRETMTAAISYALSGHLVLATLHANNSYHALGRILSFYSPEARPTLLSDLATGLRAVVSQRLLRANAGGRVPAVEVLLNTKLVSELIEQGDLSGVKEAMEKSMAEGSQTFEHDIARLINEGQISRDEGLAYADSPTNLMWRLQNDMRRCRACRPRRKSPTRPLHRDHAGRAPEGRRCPEHAAGRSWRADTLQPGRGADRAAARSRPTTPAARRCSPSACAAGFACEPLRLRAGRAACSNLWAVRRGARPGADRWCLPATPTSCPPARWTMDSDPFVPTHRDGRSTAAAPPT